MQADRLDTQPVRPAVKGANQTAVDAAEERRAIDALCKLSAARGVPLRRAEARRQVRERLGTPAPPKADATKADEERARIAYADPTGEKATRNVDRQRGVRRAD